MKFMNQDTINKHDKKHVIYYLFLDGELQYIGLTKNLKSRIKEHRLKKAFDEVRVVCHDKMARLFHDQDRIDYMRYIEACQILEYRPPLNKNLINEKNFVEFVFSLSPKILELIMTGIPRLNLRLDKLTLAKY